MGAKGLAADFDGSAFFRRAASDPSDVTADGPSIQAVPDRDAELLRTCADFRDAHDKLDRLCAFDPDQFERQLFLLNQRWSDACLTAASLAAITPEGRRAKAAMLLTVMDVVLGPDAGDRDLHELLAASLARDC